MASCRDGGVLEHVCLGRWVIVTPHYCSRPHHHHPATACNKSSIVGAVALLLMLVVVAATIASLVGGSSSLCARPTWQQRNGTLGLYEREWEWCAVNCVVACLCVLRREGVSARTK